MFVQSAQILKNSSTSDPPFEHSLLISFQSFLLPPLLQRGSKRAHLATITAPDTSQHRCALGFRITFICLVSGCCSANLSCSPLVGFFSFICCSRVGRGKQTRCRSAGHVGVSKRAIYPPLPHTASGFLLYGCWFLHALLCTWKLWVTVFLCFLHKSCTSVC